MANDSNDNTGKRPTTAYLLGTYARELDAEGINPDTISILVIEAARHLLREDGCLTVRESDQGPLK